MNTVYIPEGYRPCLNSYDTQLAIGMTKRLFADVLAGELNLRRVSAPLFVEASTGLNDDLNGVERPVSFSIKATGTEAQVVHSLAKWKRQALKRYDFHVGNGLYTDMNAIRRDEDMDNLHSIYVDQWDWEKVINVEDRTVDYLKETVKKIVFAICSTEKTLHSMYPTLNRIPLTEPEITFLTTQELEDLYPNLTPKERENAFVKEHHTVFLMQIGGKLKSGKPHDGRAPDYDDWSLNGDIIVYYPVLDIAFELSSMGIRVDEDTLVSQCKEAGAEDRLKLEFHKAILEKKLPYTIGGGIGQSRLCMFMLGKAHIGEVQSSVWDDETYRICSENGINLI